MNHDPYKIHRFINDIETDPEFRQDLVHKLYDLKIYDLPKLPASVCSPRVDTSCRDSGEPASGLFECSHCSLQFLSTYTLVSHCNQFHECKYRCQRCQKRFRCSYNFTVHCRKACCQEVPAKTTTATGVRFFRCTLANCGQLFKSRTDLVSHVSTHKPEQKKHHCTWRGCNKRFKFKKNLLNHMMLMHQERKYTCSLANCQMSFVRLIHLQKHLQDHRLQAEMAGEGEPASGKPALAESVKAKETGGETGQSDPKLKLTISNEGKVLTNSLGEDFASSFAVATFKCTWMDCNKVFKTKSAFSNHVKSHYGKYSCDWPNCVFGTNSNPIFRRHLASHRRDLIHQVPADSSPSALGQSAFHFDSEPVSLNLGASQNNHSSLEPMVIIDESLGSDTDSKSMVSDTKKIFRCDFPDCGYVTHKRPLFRVHQLKHSEIRKHHCAWPSCGKSFKAKSTLNRHIARHRSASSDYESIGPGVGYLNRPISSNSSLNNSGVHCSMQPSTSRASHGPGMSLNGYYGSIRNFGNKVSQDFRCDWPGCNYQTDKLYVILRHKAVHSGLAQFKCAQCGKEFGTSSALSNHMITHNKDRPYKCDYAGCHYETFRKSVLERHYLRAHSNEGTLYYCSKPNCKKKFKSWMDLHQHMISHNVVAKYVCSWPGCGTVFESKSLFSLHIKSHQDEAANRKALKSIQSN